MICTQASGSLTKKNVDTAEVPATDPRHDPEWAAFQAWRAETVTGLMAEIRAELPGDVTLAVIPTTQTPNDLCWIEGSDLAALARAADRLEVPAYQCGTADILADAARVREAAGDAARIGFILRPTWPHLTDADIERAVDALLEGRTAIVIAHRLETVHRADDIMILEGGAVCEHGERERLAGDLNSRFYSLLQTGLEEMLA